MRTPQGLLHWTLGCAVLLGGCADDHDHDHDHDHGTPAEEACEHLKDGPAVAVTAQTDGNATGLADVSKAHTRFDIALPAAATATYGGYVQYLSAKAGSALVVANEAVPLQVIDSLGNAVTPTSTAATPGCGAAKVQLAVPLQVGTYRLKLGPAAVSKAGVVIEAP